MAIDTWLLHQCAQGLHPPVLRFYRWSPAAISLGHNQHRWPRHWQQLTWHNQPLDLVRRPTGGRAVLHQGDLTYAIVLTEQSGNRRQTYNAICQFLIQGWQALGTNLYYGEAQRNYFKAANCFATATGADLTLADGTKVIGSAQAWRGSTVLQHGSMRLHPDPTLWTQIFHDLPSLGSVGTLKQSSLSPQLLIDPLVHAARLCFQTEFQIQPLCDSEWSDITHYLALVSDVG